MVLCALALVLLQGTVSLEADAVRTDALVADLARQTGRQLICDAVVASEPVIAQFKDQPLDDVLTHLAEVVGGEWVVKGEVWRLTRSPSLRHAQELEEAKRVADALARFGREAVRAVDALPKLDAREADLLVDRYRLAQMSPAAMQSEVMRMFRVSPVNRAATRVLAAMAPADLASIRIGGRVALSDRPTAVQGAWPPKARAALEELKRDAAMLLAAKERLGMQQRPSMNIGGMVAVGPGSVDVGYGKTVLAIQRLGFWRFRLSITMVGRDGANWLNGYSMLPEGVLALSSYGHEGPKLATSETQRAFASMRGNVGYAMAGRTWRDLPDGTRITASYGVSRAESEGRKPDLGLAELLSDPVGRDPLGIVVGDFLRRIATERGRPLLATVSDASTVGAVAELDSGQILTQDDFLDFLTQVRVPEADRSPHAEIRDSDGWLVVVPSNPVAARNQRMDRAALKALEDAIRSEGSVTVSAALRYLEKTRSRPSLGSLDTLYLSNFYPPIDRTSVQMLQSPALPFLGTSSGGLVRDLPPALRETVRRWVYEDQIFKGIDPMPEMQNAPGPLAAEPTEMFPNGVPPEARVVVDRTEAQAVIARTESGFTLFFTPEDLGYQEANPELQGPGNPIVRKLVAFRPATQTTYSVRVILTGGREARLSVVETKPRPGSQDGQRLALPKAILDRVELVRKAFAGG